MGRKTTHGNWNEQSINHPCSRPSLIIIASHKCSLELLQALYKKGMFVFLANNDEELYVGKINLVIVHHNSVHFVTEKHTVVKLIDMGIHCELGEAQEDYVCIKHNDWLDYHPHPVYKVHDLSLIAFHHYFSV